MASQLESLKASVARLEPLHGSANPFVQGLKMQIAKLEKPRAENPMSVDRLSVGTRSAPRSKTP
jgi:hypothetical protein